jgi:hypothetical protein
MAARCDSTHIAIVLRDVGLGQCNRAMLPAQEVRGLPMWGRIVLAVVVALLAAISEFIGPGTAGAAPAGTYTYTDLGAFAHPSDQCDWPGSRDRDAGDRV